MYEHLRGVVLGVVTIACIGLLMGCAGGNDNENSGGNENGGGGGGDTNSPAEGLIVGRVLSVEGDAVAGASVALSAGRSTTTDDNGFYSFSGFDADEIVVARFAASGFAPTSKSLVAARRDSATPRCVFLADAGEAVMIDADSESTQRAGESAVTLAAGSLVDSEGNPVSGDVELTTTFIDPSSTAVLAFPGSFDDATRSGGQNTTLESFGFATYELSQNGEPVDLAPGQTARIEYALPANAQDRFSVGDTIPLWEFDDDTAMWIESGTGEIGLASDGLGQLAWFADVEHFSSWNCDAPVEQKHSITGRVVFEGSPVIGAEVSGVGESYNGTSTDFSDANGVFCIDVKRGSTVSLQIRINGAAVPLSAQIVTVPDESRACPDPGLDVGSISINFDGCVQGRVMNDDGSPEVGIRVHIVPGETVTTNSDGFFCGAAAADAEVVVFAESRPSITVRTPALASCGGSCAEANLEFTLPADGDIVGFLSSSVSMNIEPTLGNTEFFGLNGIFILGDSADFANPFFSSDADSNVQDFGDCTVTTIVTSFTTDPDSFFDSFNGLGALDPGEPGTATNGSATVSLFAGDPSDANPPLPFLSGLFTPAEDSAALVALGFAANQTINWAFPGGADIGAFSGSLQMPDRLTLTAPDLSDPGLVISNSGALPFAWDAGTSEAVFVTISAATTTSTSVTTISITCEFSDSGSGTVPAGAMALLPDDASTTSITVGRADRTDVSVPLHRVNGIGIVQLTASVSVSRTLSSFDIPDIPDIPSDLCELITCPDGTTCNPATFQCE